MSIEYGCLFCRTGREDKVVLQLRQIYPQVDVIAPVKIRYRRRNNTHIVEKVKLFPGYVFFKTDSESFHISHIAILRDIIKPLLTNDGDNWQIQGSDRQLVEELFEYKGQIGLSYAYYDAGNRIRIESGFLKNYEGSIIGVNRRAKTAHIRSTINGKIFDLWLGFEEITMTESGK